MRVYKCRSFSIHRFWKRLTELKLHTDYASCDTSQLCSWLVKVDPQLLQYAYKMLSAGVTIDTLPHLTEEHLRDDCEIGNGIHRLRILQCAQGKLFNICLDFKLQRRWITSSLFKDEPELGMK